jgi:hypothetical protein
MGISEPSGDKKNVGKKSRKSTLSDHHHLKHLDPNYYLTLLYFSYY